MDVAIAGEPRVTELLVEGAQCDRSSTAAVGEGDHHVLGREVVLVGRPTTEHLAGVLAGEGENVAIGER